MITSESILMELQQQEPIALSELPDDHGVYALIDHTGLIRYIGVTESPLMGFRRRIYHYHITGSEGRSHKFSQAYNSGRMWRSRKAHSTQTHSNAKLAKSLRTQFCRKYCKATYVSIPRNLTTENYFLFLSQLENDIHAMAPTSMRLWEGIRFQSLPEPTELVDELITAAGYSIAQIDALEIQAFLWEKDNANKT